MRRLIKTFLCLALLALCGHRAWSFALLGPLPAYTGLPANFGDAWQVLIIGYDELYLSSGLHGDPVFLGDIGGPKNISEGYRRNDPVLYYAYDQNFSGFFGAQGETNVDKAFAIMNGVFTNSEVRTVGVDGYSANLTEFPFNSQHFNLTAEGYYLTDIKSVTLHLLVEQMGLAEPERYTWALHNRFLPPGGKCPVDEEYIVVQRNFGTADQPLNGPQSGTWYSPYVNNVLYSYGIADDCDMHGPPWSAITEPFGVDKTQPEFTAVAANDYEGGYYVTSPDGTSEGGLSIGGFYTGLTEDDVAGLRYLMSSNNIVYETPAAGSELEATNFSSLQSLFTSDLGALLQFAQTNPPAAVLAAFPGLVIDTVSNYFTVVTNPIVFSYFTNYPGSPAGVPPVFVVGTNGFTQTLQTNYVYTFGNVVIVDYYTNTPAQLQTVSLAQYYGSPPGTGIYTNTTVQNIVLTNVPSGDYYLLPPGSCGFDIVSTLISNHLAGITTNIIATATNTSTGFVGTESIVTYITNNVFGYYACNFQTSSPSEYQGIEHAQFVRVADSDVDPLTDTFYTPITNTYTMIVYNPTNGQINSQTFQRVVTRPDILFTATDQANGPGNNLFIGSVTRNINYEVGEILPGLAGPGVIDGETTFSFNKVGTVWWNGPFPDANSFLPGDESTVNQTTQEPSLLWASYDSTTNTPVVYPNSLSIQELQSQMLITISPTNLPAGTNGVSYTPTQFSATGGVPPYTWSLVSGSQLPSGLAFFGGLLQGTPNGNAAGPYDITVQMTDSALPAHVVTTPYTITIAY